MTYNPTSPKVIASGVAGAVSIVLVYLVHSFTTLEVPGEVASALTVIVMAVIGFAKGDPLRVPYEPRHAVDDDI